MLSHLLTKVSTLWKEKDYRLALERMDTAYIEPEEGCYLERCRVDNGAFVGATAHLDPSNNIVRAEGSSMRYLKLRNL